jgi:hypothetical protein
VEVWHRSEASSDASPPLVSMDVRWLALACCRFAG